MTITGKKESGQKQTPEKKAEYTLVYENKKPNRVKPPKKKKTPKPDPVYFVMEHSNLFDSDDDTI